MHPKAMVFQVIRVPPDRMRSIPQPNSSKKKKFYLILFAGQPVVGGKPQPIKVPEGLTDDPHGGGPSTVAYEKKRADAEARKKLQRKKRRSGGKGSKNKDSEGAKEYIMRKKELYRQRGKDGVPRDSKSVALPWLSPSLQNADRGSSPPTDTLPGLASLGSRSPAFVLLSASFTPARFRTSPACLLPCLCCLFYATPQLCSLTYTALDFQ